MNNRQYSLDFLKTLATAFIIFHHYQQYISGAFINGINFYDGVYNFGYMVELFFILSGYFMYPHIKKIQNGVSFKKFFGARYFRLIPLVAVAAFVYQFCVFVHIKLVGMAWFMRPISLWETIVAALGFQEGWVFVDNIYINYPLWYISVVLICYMLFYFATFFSKKLCISGRYAYLFLIFLGIAICSYGWQLPLLNAYTARGYYAFFTGVLFATYYYEKKVSKVEIFISSSVIFVLTGIIVLYNHYISSGTNFISTFIFFPAIILVFKSPFMDKIFSKKIFQVLAEISYNAFVWHMPLLIVVLILANIVDFGQSLFSRMSMFVFLIIAYGIGTISYFEIENKIKKFFERKKE